MIHYFYWKNVNLMRTRERERKRRGGKKRKRVFGRNCSHSEPKTRNIKQAKWKIFIFYSIGIIWYTMHIYLASNKGVYIFIIVMNIALAAFFKICIRLGSIFYFKIDVWNPSQPTSSALYSSIEYSCHYFCIIMFNIYTLNFSIIGMPKNYATHTHL